MHTMVTRLIAIIGLVFSCSLAHAGKSKKNDVAISFHVQTDASNNPKLIFPVTVGQNQVYVRRSPDFSNRDIASFEPFPSKDGASNGAVLILKMGAKSRLSAITNSNLDKIIVTVVNGNMIQYMVIDQNINDGNLVIWKGLSDMDIKLMDKKFKRTSEIGKKKK